MSPDRTVFTAYAVPPSATNKATSEIAIAAWSRIDAYALRGKRVNMAEPPPSSTANGLRLRVELPRALRGASTMRVVYLQTTLTHWRGSPLPFALLPPPSVAPATDSMPSSVLSLALLREIVVVGAPL